MPRTRTCIRGADYQINEQNARAMGMGSAFSALAADTSAVFFNPTDKLSVSVSFLCC